MRPVFFVTGIGTDVGKTLVSAILAEAMQAHYWKPIQAGYENGTDAGQMMEWLTDPAGRIQPEVYKLRMPASPHISAREEGIRISLQKIKQAYDQLLYASNQPLIIEGAGGLMVPLNDTETMLDLLQMLDARVILVSRNYLGSINHSLLTAKVLNQYGIKAHGWVFNDQFMQYEEEICSWTGLPLLASVPFTASPGKEFIRMQAAMLGPSLKNDYDQK